MAPGRRSRESAGSRAGERPPTTPRGFSSAAGSADAVLYVPLAAVLVALIVVYAPVRDAQFVQWDDFKTIAGNPDLNPPSPSRILRYWDPRRPHMDLYVPVTYTAWAVVASVSAPPASRQGATRAGTPRLDPADFHTASIAVHAIATIFAFLILRKLLAAHGVPGERAAWAAGVGAGLFALHPLQVESVAWASGLKDLLGGAFTLAALWLYLRYVAARRTAASLAAGAVDLALATLAFVLAMLSKPSAVVTPLLAGCLLLVLPRRPASEDASVTGSAPDDGASPGRRTLSSRLAGLAPVLAPLALWCVLALPVMLIARSAQPAASGFASPLWARPLVALDALAFYAVKLALPVSLALDYGRSPDWLATTHWIWWTWLVPVVLGAAVVLLRRRAPWLVGAALFPVAALLTVLGLLRFDFQSHSTVADHYVYVALLGPALALAFVLSRASAARIVLAGGLLLLSLAGLARAQVLVWHDSWSLFTHTLDVNPRSTAGHINLGHLLYVRGRTDEALRHDEAALATRPDEPEAHNNLGNALRRLKRPKEAAEHFRAAIAVQPGNARTHFNLGLALTDQGDLEGAARAYEEALRLDPGYAAALANRAELHLNAGEFEKAAAGYRRALAADPNLQPARRGLANALAGRAGEGPRDETAATGGAEGGEAGPDAPD